jgi:hypothetical protein
MKGRFLILWVCVLVVAAIAVVPAGANSKQGTGDRLGLGAAGPATFAANTPFYTESGFACDLGDGFCLATEIGRGELELYVDGALVASTVDVERAHGTISKLFLSSFPQGLPAGAHTFERVWLQSGVVVETSSKTITFG